MKEYIKYLYYRLVYGKPKRTLYSKKTIIWTDEDDLEESIYFTIHIFTPTRVIIFYKSRGFCKVFDKGADYAMEIKHNIAENIKEEML